MRNTDSFYVQPWANAVCPHWKSAVNCALWCTHEKNVRLGVVSTELAGLLSKGKLQRLFSIFCLSKLIFELPCQHSTSKLQRRLSNFASSNASLNFLAKGKLQRLFSNFEYSNASSNFLVNSREANFNGCSATFPLQTHLWTSWSTLERQISTAGQQTLPLQIASLNFLAHSREAD